MRRKVANVPNGRQKAFIYTCSLLALVAYGLPRLPALKHGLAGSFSVVWILFAALTISANLYFLFGADKERSRMLEAQESSVLETDVSRQDKIPGRSY